MTVKSVGLRHEVLSQREQESGTETESETDKDTETKRALWMSDLPHACEMPFSSSYIMQPIWPCCGKVPCNRYMRLSSGYTEAREARLPPQASIIGLPWIPVARANPEPSAIE